MKDQKTALLIVDMQRDLASPEGVRFHERAPTVIEPIQRLREKAREWGWPILYTRTVHETWAFDEGSSQRPWCLRGTPGVEILPECKPSPDEIVIRKRTLDGFLGTELDSVLRHFGVERLVLAGVNSNEGVLVTAGEAALRWYDIVLPIDATAAAESFDKQATLREIAFLYQGRLTTVESLLAGSEAVVEPDLKVSPPPQKRSESIQLPASETALIVVDMQNDFAREGGTLFVPDTAETIEPIGRLLDKARKAGATVVFTQDWHRPDDAEFKIWPVHAVAGTPGAEVIDPLEAREDEIRVTKLRYDAFHGTSLDHLLRLKGIRNVVVVGTVSNICVLHTAGKASLHGYRVVVAEDGISSLDPFDQALALRQVTEVFSGEVCSSGGIIFP
jgi:nicotinamidase-related amidase